MSLKLDKHMILIFMVFLMLVIMPMSFASEVNGENGVIGSVDESVLTKSVDNVNATLSASVDTSDILKEGNAIYVDKNSASDTEDGSEDNPYKSISGAIAKANSGDESTIYIASANYEEYGFSLSKSVTIIGTNMDDVVIDAQNKGRIFDIVGNNINVQMENLTLKNGLASGTTVTGSGGAIRAGQTGTSAYNQVNLFLNRIVFDSNSATQGGAVFISQGQLMVTSKPINNLNVENCIFKNNIASGHAGAIYTRANTNITGSIFSNNRLEHSGTSGSQYGGAIYIYHSYMSLNINGSTFEKNSATGKGGALYYAGPSTASIKYNAFIDNTASYITGTGDNQKNLTDYGISASSEANVKKMDLNNNWWGYNDVNFTKEIAYGSSLSLTYAQLNLTANPNEITTAETSEITTSFKWDDDTTTDIDKLPVRTVKYDSNGTLTASEGNVGLESTFSADIAGTYYVNATVDNQKLSENIDVLEGSSKWYVDDSVENSGDGKSKENAFKTIKEATDAAEDGDTIYILEGNYLITNTVRITGTDSKNLNIIGEGEVKITGSTNIFNFGGSKTYTLQGLTFDGISRDSYGVAAINSATSVTKINLIDCNFTNNNGGTIVRIAGESSIIRCNFINNTATGNTLSPINVAKGVIDYFEGSGLTVNYCNFINNDFSIPGVLIYSGGSSGNIDYNFWGSNDGPSNDTYTSSKLTLNNYLIINATIDNKTVNVDNNYNLNFKFQSTVDGTIFSDLEDNMPNVTFNLVSKLNNELGSDSITMQNNEATTTYDANNNGGEVIEINYVSNVSELSFVVRPDAVTFDVEDMEMTYGNEESLNVTVKDSSANTIEVPVAININGQDKDNMISTDGQITFDDLKEWAAGTYTINLTVKTEDYNGNKTVTVKINKATSSFTVDSDNVSLYVDDTKQIIISDLIPSDAELSYESNDSSIASVENGLITANGDGSVNITISIGESENYTAFIKSVNVTVSKIPTEINLNQSSISLDVLDTQNTGATLNSSEAGSLSYKSSDENVAKVDENGLITAVGKGNANITVYFNGNEKYAAAENKTISVSVELDEASVSSKDIELNVGENTTIEVTTTPAGLNVTYDVADKTIVSVDENGTATALKAGNTTITILIKEDGIHSVNSTTINVSVSLNDASVSVENDTLDLTVDDEDSIVVTTTPSDLTVKYESNDTTVATVDGEGNVVAVGEGTAVITVSVGDGVTYAVNSTTVTVSVSKVPTEISVEVDNVELKVGENVSAGANLTPADAGNVQFTSSNESVVKVEDGELVAVGAGGAIVTVSFAGDDKYSEAESKTIAVSVSLNDASVSVENDALDLTVDDESSIVAITTPSGLAVNYESNDTNVATVDENGLITAVGEGTAIITVSVGDGVTYAVNSTTVTVTVNPKEEPVPSKEDLNISVSADPITAGDDAVIEVSGLGDATGNVTASVNGEEYTAPIVDGVALITVPGLAENVTAVVSYPGDDMYNNFTESVDIVVNPKEEPVPSKENATMDVSVDSITEGEDAIVNVVLPEDASGNVTVGNTTVPVVNGTASVPVSGLKEGNTTLPVVYSGDDKYNPAETNVTVTVNPKEEPVPSKEDLNISVVADEFIVGEDAVIEVSGLEDATGNVTVTVNGKDYTAPIVDGVALITVPGLAENVTAVVSYPGDDKYNNFTESVDIVVNPKEEPKENATMDISSNSPTEGENTTIDVTLPKDATGNVTATVDGKNYTAPVKDGKATLDIPALAAGNYTVPVTYSGDDKYNPITKDIEVSVEEDKSDIISAPDVTKYYGGSERFVVNVTDSEGNPVANKSVTIVINGQKYDRTTKADGTTSIGLSLNSGVYNATVTVDNKTINSVVTVLSTVNGTDVVKVYRNATQYYATFRDSEGNYLKEGTVVTFNINGVMYERKISGSEGLAKLNLNLEQGTYVLTAMNPETGENAANNITIIARLIENKDITKYYRNATQYTVKVIGDDGKAVGAGESVTFNINGVFYTRQTNESGIAKLNLNLQPGDYIITAEYKNCKVSNNIKVLPVLSAEDISMKYRDGTQFKAKLVDGQGKPLANEKIEFNINGVFYYRTTGSEGIAKLNINLQAGEYIITSSYNGANIANTVTVAA